MRCFNKMLALAIIICLLAPTIVLASTDKYAIEEIEYKSNTDTISFSKDDPDENIRYIGENPNNYIEFNGELWRIIGIIKNIKDADGNTASRIKIIRNDILLNLSWDGSDHSINDGQGVNEWSTSNINKILNEDGYINKKSVTCENGINGATNICDFTATGLNDDSKELIDSVIWDLGSNWDINYRNAKASEFYQFPYSGKSGNYCTTGSYCTDTVDRTLTFTGLIGLIYPADYIYATAGNSTTSREACLNDTVIKDWDDNNPDCYNTNWLTTNIQYWTMTPYTDTTYNSTAFFVKNKVGMRAGYYSYGLRPVVYLSNNLVIKSGNGSESSPYKVVLGRKVTFETNGGAKISNQVDELNTQAQYVIPERDGYNFGGWYLDKEYTTQFDFASNVSEDITLYAKWTKNDDIGTPINDTKTRNDDIEIKNPQTGDNLAFNLLMLGLSIINLTGAVLYLKKKDFINVLNRK